MRNPTKQETSTSARKRMNRINQLAIFTFFLIVFALGCQKEEALSPSCPSDSSTVNRVDNKKSESTDQVKATPHFSFVAIGDNGCDCPAEGKIAARMLGFYEENPYNLVLMLGDNIYGTWSKRGGDPDLFPDRFDKYYKVLEDRGVKFHAALGNHDIEDNNGLYEIKDTARFGIMGKDGYYSYTPDIKVGQKPLITFFALNSNRMVHGKKDEVQIKWLERALSESNAIWKVAYFHHPLYSPYGAHKPDFGFHNAVEETLVNGGVQVAIAGHNHYYARMKPQKGIIHFISGGGGANLKKPKANGYTACALEVNNFIYMEVYPEWISFRAISSEGQVIDSGIIDSRTSFHSRLYNLK